MCRKQLTEFTVFEIPLKAVELELPLDLLPPPAPGFALMNRFYREQGIMSRAAVYLNKIGARIKIQELRSRIFPSVRRYRLTEPPTCSPEGPANAGKNPKNTPGTGFSRVHAGAFGRRPHASSVLYCNGL